MGVITRWLHAERGYGSLPARWIRTRGYAIRECDPSNAPRFVTRPRESRWFITSVAEATGQYDRSETRLLQALAHHRAMNTKSSATVLIAAAVTGLFAVACGGQATSDPPTHGGTAAKRTYPQKKGDHLLLSPIIIRQPISAAERQAMVAWLTDWRSCMSKHGVDLPTVEVHQRHVSIDVSGVAGYAKPGAPLPATPPPFMVKSQSCIAAFGAPKWTFLRTGGIVDVFVGYCALAPASASAKS
jgi:hypothetical protein